MPSVVPQGSLRPCEAAAQIGDFVFFNQVNARYEQALSTSAGPVVGVLVWKETPASVVCSVLSLGEITGLLDDLGGALVPGASYYISAVVPGGVSAIQGTKQRVGVATSTNSIYFSSEPGPGGALAFAEFFALMPGDNAAPIAAGAAFLFPQNGATSGTIVRTSSSQFELPTIGVYEVFWQASIAEAGQMMLGLDEGGGVVELAETVAGRATPTSQIMNKVLITTTVVGAVLTVINPSGNPTALTLTVSAGGTHSVSATLVIKQLS